MNTEPLVVLAAYGITDDPTTDPEVLADLATGVLDDLERDITGMWKASSAPTARARRHAATDVRSLVPSAPNEPLDDPSRRAGAHARYPGKTRTGTRRPTQFGRL